MSSAAGTTLWRPYWTHGQGFHQRFPAGSQGPQGGTEHPADPDRRRGIWRQQHFWRPGSDADLGSAGQERSPLHGIPHHGAVSPTRAALLTGRNHHSANTGVIMEGGTGFPGYNSLMSKSVGTFAEALRQNGYNTAWYGKNHNVPDWQSAKPGRLICGRPVWALNISTALSAATPASGRRRSSKHQAHRAAT